MYQGAVSQTSGSPTLSVQGSLDVEKNTLRTPNLKIKIWFSNLKMIQINLNIT
jgi:hypothetical protein